MSNTLKQAEIGQRIRLARERIPYSQRELADLVGKDQKAIYAYETGERKISAVDLARIGQALNVSVGYFFAETSEDDDLDRMLLQEFHALPTSIEKKDAISLLRILVNFSQRTKP